MSKAILPPEWIKTPLEKVVEILNAKRIPVNNTQRQLRIANKSDDALFPYYGATGEAGKIDGYIFDEELVALGEDGVPFLDPQKNKAYMLYGKTWVNNHAHVLKAIPSLSESRFLCYFLNQFDYHDYVNGGVHLKLTQARMRNIPFYLAPLAEQKVIADRLDDLLVRIESIKRRLKKISDMFKNFRHSVLSAAVSGELVQMNTEMQTLTTLGNVAEDIRYGTSRKCFENKGDTAVLRIPNIGPGYIINSNLKYACFAPKELSAFALKKGDLLLIRSNGSIDLVGKVAVISEKETDYLYAGYLIRIRLNQEKAVPEYISYCLQSPLLRQLIENIARSTSGVNNINSKELASLAFVLPSLPEQQAIVQRVEQLFGYADTIEKQTSQALKQVNYLSQSILAKAFCGELTAQWRKKNPELIRGLNSAEALLEKSAKSVIR
ncbi:restriction endonuclease subunit S [Enterobacteriaceae bacterium LUAb1]